MSRGKKALINSIASIVSQIISMICGFILPRLILSAFGSSYNGITSSVSQFLSMSSLIFAGVGGATRASLYRSLAKKDTQQISATIKATEIFMRKVALIFLGITVAFSLGYPYLVRNEFNYLFSATLVLIVSISTFVQYYFGYAYRILFQADQRQYVYSLLGAFVVLINTVIATILIKAGVGIHGVKLGSAAAFCITPLALNVLAKKRYRIDRHAKPDFSSISQRWDAFFHHAAWFIHNNTDITLLTIFSNTKEISVYTVYYLVANSLKSVISTLMVGVEAAFGNILANQEDETLKKDVEHYETMLHVFSSFLFGAASVLVTPFIQVYTNGITDANYTRYTFGYLAIWGEMLYILRSPYEALVNAAGHFRQTKKYAFLEASMNILISVIMVQRYGLVGVVVGTVAAILVRNYCYGLYASKYLIHRSFMVVVKRYIITGLTVVSILFFSKFIPKPEMTTYLKWIVYAIEVSIISIVITCFFNLLFYKTELILMLIKVKKIAFSLFRKNIA